MDLKKLKILLIIASIISFLYISAFYISRFIKIKEPFSEDKKDTIKTIPTMIYVAPYNYQLIGVLPNQDLLIIDNKGNLKIQREDKKIQLGKFNLDSGLVDFKLIKDILIITDHDLLQIYKINDDNLYRLFNNNFHNMGNVSISSVYTVNLEKLKFLITVSNDEPDDITWASKLIEIDLSKDKSSINLVKDFTDDFVISDFYDNKVILVQELPFVENLWIIFDMSNKNIEQLECAQALIYASFDNKGGIFKQYSKDVSNYCPNLKAGLYLNNHYIKDIDVLTTYNDFVLYLDQDDRLKVSQYKDNNLIDLETDNEIIVDPDTNLIPLDNSDIIDKDLIFKNIDLKTVDNQLMYRLVIKT